MPVERKFIHIPLRKYKFYLKYPTEIKLSLELYESRELLDASYKYFTVTMKIDDFKKHFPKLYTVISLGETLGLDNSDLKHRIRMEARIYQRILLDLLPESDEIIIWEARYFHAKHGRIIFKVLEEEEKRLCMSNSKN